jgi:hypothetical protein
MSSVNTFVVNVNKTINAIKAFFGFAKPKTKKRHFGNPNARSSMQLISEVGFKLDKFNGFVPKFVYAFNLPVKINDDLINTVACYKSLPLKTDVDNKVAFDRFANYFKDYHFAITDIETHKTVPVEVKGKTYNNRKKFVIKGIELVEGQAINHVDFDIPVTTYNGKDITARCYRKLDGTQVFIFGSLTDHMKGQIVLTTEGNTDPTVTHIS